MRERIAKQCEAISVGPEDDRVKVSDGTRKRMQDKGLKFPLPPGPLTVIMETDFMHTPAFPICDDPGCICQRLGREQIIEETTPKRRRRRQIFVDTNCEAALSASIKPAGGFSLLR